jgi:hypothetical protein
VEWGTESNLRPQITCTFGKCVAWSNLVWELKSFHKI